MSEVPAPPRLSIPTGRPTRFEVRVGFAAGAAALIPIIAMLLLEQGAVPITILIVATVPSALIAWWVARRIARRVRLLAVATARVGQGDLGVRVRPRGSDEIDALMRAFNSMVEDMQQSRSRIEYLQRIGAWQQFAQRLAHEIKNPLTPIQLAIQEVAKKYRGDDPAFAKTLETAREVIEEEVETLRRLVAAFSDLGTLPDVNAEPADLRAFLIDAEQSHAFLDKAAADQTQHVTVKFNAPDTEVNTRIDRMLMRRVLDNLIRNAAQAGAINVWVRTERTERDAKLIVEDDGPGIPEAKRDRVFDPYYTTKQEGTGLGLSIVRKIAIDHEGDVIVQAREGGGARFVITLPLLVQRDDPKLSFVTFSGKEPIHLGHLRDRAK